MHDQHSVDEAESGRAQQEAAGHGQRPVRTIPSHGEEPVLGESPGALRSRYEDALRREHDAWEQVGVLPGEAGFSTEAWEQWRDAVDAREKAARMLINYGLTVERSPSPSPSPG